MPMMAAPDRTAEMDRGECMRLLAGEAVGRVVFTTAAMPAAQPVAFVVDRDEIVFRADGALGAARNAVVAFEADNIDRLTLTGWSVLGIGGSYEVTDPTRLAGLLHLPGALLGAAPWPAPVIAIQLRHLTGRLLRPAVAAPA
jgi:uncharacterized protein